MKTYLSMVASLCFLCVISSCANQTPETTTQETTTTTTTTTNGSSDKTINVTSPQSGQYNNVPNNGSTGAAKMISPLTQ